LHQDGNGYIDRGELATMLRFLGEPMTEEEINSIIEEADKDKDGVIDYAEFFTMMSTSDLLCVVCVVSIILAHSTIFFHRLFFFCPKYCSFVPFSASLLRLSQMFHVLFLPMYCL